MEFERILVDDREREFWVAIKVLVLQYVLDDGGKLDEKVYLGDIVREGAYFAAVESLNNGAFYINKVSQVMGIVSGFFPQAAGGLY